MHWIELVLTVAINAGLWWSIARVWRAIRALQQVYAATHPAAFIEKEKAPQTQRTADAGIADLLTALDRDAAEDREE